MKQYYVTFGQKYRTDKHPTYRDAHPDGYYLIEAEDLETATLIAFATFNANWANIYSEEEFDSSFYSKGQLNS